MKPEMEEAFLRYVKCLLQMGLLGLECPDQNAAFSLLLSQAKPTGFDSI